MEKDKRLRTLDSADIYPVIGEEFCDGRNPLDILRMTLDGGAKIVQLREKSKSARETFSLAEGFMRICSEFGALLIVNDRLDIALSCGADGVHLGQDDLPLHAARAIAEDMIIGVSTHSREQAMAAQSHGADYINLGPVFQTSTKALKSTPLGMGIVAECAPLLSIPFSVMGGIKAEHVVALRKAGARMIAMVTEITLAQDVKAKTCELRRIWQGVNF